MVQKRKEDKDKRKERVEALPEIPKRVSAVFKQLEPLLTNSSDRELLRRVLPKVEARAANLEDWGEVRSLGAAWEEAALLLILEAVSQQDRENYPSDRTEKIINDIFKSKSDVMWPKPAKKAFAVRQLLMESGFEIAAVSDEVIRASQERYTDPQDVVSNITLEMVWRTLEEILRTGKYYEGGDESKPLLRLPLSTRQGARLTKLSYTNIDDDPDTIFGATAVGVSFSTGERKVVPIVFQDTSDFVVQHERNHRDHPGVKIGSFRISLNEALTNLLAEQIRKEPASGYKIDAELLNRLPNAVQKALMRRYLDDSVQNSRSLTATIINELGLGGYLNLALALPMHIPKKIVNERGRIQVQEVLDEIKRKSGLFGKLKNRFNL